MAQRRGLRPGESEPRSRHRYVFARTFQRQLLGLVISRYVQRQFIGGGIIDADGQFAALGHLPGPALWRIALANWAAGERDRRLAGVNGRRNPRIKPERGDRLRRAQIKRTGDTLAHLTPGCGDRDDKQQPQERTKRKRIRPVGARMGTARLQLFHRSGHPLAIRQPKRARGRARLARRVVLKRRRRAVWHPGAFLQTAQRLIAGRRLHAQHRHQRGDKSDREGP